MVISVPILIAPLDNRNLKERKLRLNNCRSRIYHGRFRLRLFDQTFRRRRQLFREFSGAVPIEQSVSTSFIATGTRRSNLRAARTPNTIWPEDFRGFWIHLDADASARVFAKIAELVLIPEFLAIALPCPTIGYVIFCKPTLSVFRRCVHERIALVALLIDGEPGCYERGFTGIETGAGFQCLRYRIEFVGCNSHFPCTLSAKRYDHVLRDPTPPYMTPPQHRTSRLLGESMCLVRIRRSSQLCHFLSVVTQVSIEQMDLHHTRYARRH